MVELEHASSGCKVGLVRKVGAFLLLPSPSKSECIRIQRSSVFY